MLMFTFHELVDIVIMVVAVGFIFKDLFKLHSRFEKTPFMFACLVTAPALIFHELAHKFVALGFGIDATFHAAYFWLVIGLVLKMLNFPFIFFVPAFVSIQGDPSTLASTLIAGSGPFLNAVLFGIAWFALRQKKLKTRTFILLQVTKQINGFLFIFNMLPFPPFDGFTFFSGLKALLFPNI